MGHSIGHVLERTALDTGIEITMGNVYVLVYAGIQYMVEHQNCDPSLLIEFRKLAECFEMPTDENHPEWNTLCAKNLSLLTLDKKSTHTTSSTLDKDCGKVIEANIESSNIQKQVPTRQHTSKDIPLLLAESGKFSH